MHCAVTLSYVTSTACHVLTHDGKRQRNVNTIQRSCNEHDSIPGCPESHDAYTPSALNIMLCCACDDMCICWFVQSARRHSECAGAVDRPLPAVPSRPAPAEPMGNEPDTILHLTRQDPETRPLHLNVIRQGSITSCVFGVFAQSQCTLLKILWYTTGNDFSTHSALC